MKPRLLIVDDEAGVRAFLTDLFRAEDYDVDVATDADTARALVRDTRYDLVFSDIMMPGDDGITLLRDLRAADAALPVVLITGYPSIQTAVNGLRLGAADYVTKPCSPDELRIVARRILEHRRLQDENRHFRDGAARRAVGRIVAVSEPMREVMKLVEKFAATDGTVLITGESGTGKDLIADAIHHLSERRARERVTVNCGAIAPTLIESELFGHAKGAFTGAVRRKEGLFLAADRGTLFLDEIGELPLMLQPKLLRALQTGEVQEVGATRPLKVDVRLIAATNRDLEVEAKEGRFRTDLFYRLNVLRVHVPPLRERPEDVPALAERFLARYASRRVGGPRRLSREATLFLQSQPWPGNVRELENAIERAAVLGGSSDALERDDFSFLLRDGTPKPPPAHYPFSGIPLEEMERVHILNVLEACGGNHTVAANVLGIHRTTIWKKLRERERN